MKLEYSVSTFSLKKTDLTLLTLRSVRLNPKAYAMLQNS